MTETCAAALALGRTSRDQVHIFFRGRKYFASGISLLLCLYRTRWVPKPSFDVLSSFEPSRVFRPFSQRELYDASIVLYVYAQTAAVTVQCRPEYLTANHAQVAAVVCATAFVLWDGLEMMH